MRLLHVIASADPETGGPIEGLIRQNEATRDRVQRHLVTLDPPDAPFLANLPIDVTALGRPRKGGWRSPVERYGYNPDFIPWLRSNRSGYDIAVVHGLWNYAAFGAAAVLPGSDTPYFVFTHGMMDPWFRRRYPVKHAAKQLFWLFVEGRLLANARSVLFTTEAERRLARGVFFGHDYREAVVDYGTGAPPPPDADQTTRFRATVPRLGDRSYLLYISRIHAKKGVDLLLSAFAAIAAERPDLDLVIAGPGEPGLVAALKRQAASLGVGDRLHWPGMLQGAAKWGAFRNADAFVLTSHQENFGVVVAEALGCGLPVLISDKVNIWREVEDAGAGLAAHDDADGARSLLTRWIAMAPERREAMRRAAAALFRQRYDVAATAPRLVETMERLR